MTETGQGGISIMSRTLALRATHSVGQILHLSTWC